MLNVQRMRVLKEVAEQGSFSAAAEALSFSQPAVSKQVAQLEREAGATLVRRTPRGVELTEAGRVVVEHADAILTSLSAAQTQLEALAQLETGRLRLAAFPSADAMLVPDAIAIFSERYPEVELTLEEVVSDEGVAAVRAGEVDLALISDYGDEDAWDAHGLELVHIADDPMCIAMSNRHPLAGRERIHIEDLRDEIWIEGLRPQCFRPLQQKCAAAGFEPKLNFQCTQWLGKQGLVAAGVGIALIPGLAAAAVRDDIVLHGDEHESVMRRVYAAHLPGDGVAPAVPAMIEILREAAERCLVRYRERIV